MFVLQSDITIGNFKLSGTNYVRIRRSLFSLADMATISLPSIARVDANGQTDSKEVITGKQFKDGDAVTINLGYDGALKSEFKGFVKRCSLGLPLEIECEGYSWLLKRNKVKEFWQTVTVRNLLEAALAGIDPTYKITIQCPVDYTLTNISVNGTGFDAINAMVKATDGCLTCFFIQPDVLWCGLAYSAYARGDDIFDNGRVSYRLGYNSIKSNSLKMRSEIDDPVQVIYTKRKREGDNIAGISSVFPGALKTQAKILSQVNDMQTLTDLANEKAFRLNYSGYEGGITAFLQPYCGPGCVAYLTDERYPERNGNYLIEGVEVTFGLKGARRILQPGPLLGFDKTK